MQNNSFRYCLALLPVLGVFATTGCGGSGSGGGGGGGGVAAKYVQTNLVADTAAGQAKVTDPNLVNPWGMAYSPSGAFWISDNTSGLVTLYNSAGAIQPLVVTIPAAGGGTHGPVDGQVYNGTSDFAIGATGAATFIMSSEDGLITAWNSGATAMTVVDRSATGAVYKGLAIGSSGGANFLYATNFNANSVDMFNGTFTLTKSFTDPSVPAGYAPFGIANIGGNLFVSYALQDAAKHDDVKGAGNGFVDEFQTNGTFVKRLISNGLLNSPWGLVQAPSAFGGASNALLVGNFGDGHINAYNISTGAAVTTLDNTSGTPLAIDGLWGLTFGNGGQAGPTTTLYFTAGPDSESHGLLGSLTAQ